VQSNGHLASMKTKASDSKYSKSSMSMIKNAVHPFNSPIDTSIMTANLPAPYSSRVSKKVTSKDKKMKGLSNSRMIQAPLMSARLEKSYPIQSKNAVIQSPRVTIDVTNQQVFTEKMNVSPENT
jgi:hypothetical protein